MDAQDIQDVHQKPVFHPDYPVYPCKLTHHPPPTKTAGGESFPPPAFIVMIRTGASAPGRVPYGFVTVTLVTP
jgi:hypothetical protein